MARSDESKTYQGPDVGFTSYDTAVLNGWKVKVSKMKQDGLEQILVALFHPLLEEAEVQFFTSEYDAIRFIQYYVSKFA